MLFFKLAAVPLAVLVLFLIYRYLPNGRPPLDRVIPAAIVVGLLMELLKYINTLVWPGFQRKLATTQDVIDEVELALPAQTLVTKALWWLLTPEVLRAGGIGPTLVPGSAHAAEHAAIGLLPLVATCDRWDIGGLSTPLHPDTGEATIFIYDGYPGGAGIAERGHRSGERLLEATLEAVHLCPCARGCPSCIQSPKCGNGNEPLDKLGAVHLVAAMLGREPS